MSDRGLMKEYKEQTKGESNMYESKPSTEEVKTKKKFFEMGLKEICSMPYTRKWNFESGPIGSGKNFLKRFKQRRKLIESHECPRKLSEYERSLWIPLCEPKPKPADSVVPFDETICVFCSGNLYVGGYLHELYKKVPLIKKQSEIYGDEIANRIGIRTRIIVHKKCYNSYMESISKKVEGIEVDIKSEESEDEESLNCYVNKEGDLENGQLEQYQNMATSKENSYYGSKTHPKHYVKVLKVCRKQHFCLGKFQPPIIDPDDRIKISTTRYLGLNIFMNALLLGISFKN